MATTPVQTSYTDALSLPFAGVIANCIYAPEIATGINNDAASVPFGWGVARDTSLTGAPQLGAKLPAATTDKFFGITVHSHAYSAGVGTTASADLDTVGMKTGVMMNIMRHGRIWANAELGSAPGDRGFVRCTAAGLGKGSLLNSDPGSNTVIASTGKILEWQTSAAATALAVLEVFAMNA